LKPGATAEPMSKPIDNLNAREAGGEAGWLELVRQQVGSLRYGVVQIVVHDARVTQIEKTERVRLESPRLDSHRQQ
jgi:hypothetical protein